ncbi:MAG: hypothetical protein KC619_05125 [Myxococcales bacterium]|nr:hypothetical protein [Myxococcales bacterium]
MGVEYSVVKELSSERADPAFGESIRDQCLGRGGEDLHVLGSEDLVERIDELAATVAHERPCVGELVAVAKHQVRAAWVVQARVGCSVMPPRCTVRVGMSMKKSG